MPVSDFETDGFAQSTTQIIRRSYELIALSDNFLRWTDQCTRQSIELLDRSRTLLMTLKSPTRLRSGSDVTSEQQLTRLGAE
jgi:hypothetical protein